MDAPLAQVLRESGINPEGRQSTVLQGAEPDFPVYRALQLAATPLCSECASAGTHVVAAELSQKDALNR
jgi:hypothetical protein